MSLHTCEIFDDLFGRDFAPQFCIFSTSTIFVTTQKVNRDLARSDNSAKAHARSHERASFLKARNGAREASVDRRVLFRVK